MSPYEKCMSFMLSDWMGSLIDSTHVVFLFHHNEQTTHGLTLASTSFISAILSLPPLLCKPCGSNKVCLNSLSYWTGSLLFLLPPQPPIGTGCTVYPRTRVQCVCVGGGGGGGGGAVGGLFANSANWHGEPPSLMLLCPPAPIPGPGRQACHYQKSVCVCVCVCENQSISANSLSLATALCVLLLWVNLPGSAVLAVQYHLGWRWNLKAKVLVALR